MQALASPTLAISLLLNLALPSVSMAYEQGSLHQCQSIKNNVQRYTDKRRQGGSASKMFRWQKQRNLYKSRYTQLNCKAHQRLLKQRHQA